MIAQTSCFIEPALELHERATVKDALPALERGRPAWFRLGATWAAVLPDAAVGHARSRRIIDLPLRAVEAVSEDRLDDDPDGAEDAGGFVPVEREGRLVGQVRRDRLRSSLGETAFGPPW